jgi:glucosamine--fructose-6-phosphate aminotransferase (isomerizing)
MCSSWENIDGQFTKEKQIAWAQIKHLHIVACGSAMHAGLLARYAIEKLAQIPVTVHIASEFRYYPPIFMDGDAVMVISQSGETADTLAALRLAKEKGLATFAVVNVVGSSIAREAQTVFYTYAGPEIAVATTKGYTSQAALLYLFAMQVAKEKGLIDAKTHQAYLQDLKQIALDLEKPLENETISRVAKVYADKEDAFFIGRSQDYALCCEGSLKWKEISYIHSEAYAAGELKHGTISLITKDTPVIAVITDPEIAAKTFSNIQETRTRGANVTLIATCKVEDATAFSDFFISLPSVNPLFDGLTVAVVMQKLAYDVANIRGCEIDQPRNLAKSVTVE